MSFSATARFKCNGCKVIDSEPILLEADVLQAVPPARWLRVENMQNAGTMDVRAIHHYCPACAPLIRSYLF